MLKHRLGRGWRIAAIGPAGERGVRYATLSHAGWHAGRGGLGAVLGAKNIKAVAVRATTKIGPADPDGVLAAARQLRERSFGPATAKYRDVGDDNHDARRRRGSASGPRRSYGRYRPTPARRCPACVAGTG